MRSLHYLLLLLIPAFLAAAKGSAQPSDNLLPTQPPSHLESQFELSPKQKLVAERFFNLTEKRLEIIHRVAKWKWNNGAYIRDRNREASLLHSFTEKSSTFGLPKAWTRRFLKKVLKVACNLQKIDITEWREERRGHFANVQDLRSELDPKLDSVTEEMLQTITEIKELFPPKKSYALKHFFEQKIEKSSFPKKILTPLFALLINLIEKKAPSPAEDSNR